MVTRAATTTTVAGATDVVNGVEMYLQYISTPIFLSSTIFI